MLAVVGLVLAVAPASAAGPEVRASGFRGVAGRVWRSPARLAGTVVDNYKAGRFYATDLTVHPTVRTALARSIRPLDLGENLTSVLKTRLHPVKLVTGIWGPVSLVAQRALADGRLPTGNELTDVLRPGSLIVSQVGGLAGDLVGASAHSLLSRMGPAGAAAGLVLRPLLAQSGQMAGLNVGKGLDEKLSLKAAIAQGLREIRPLRELGNASGYAIGMIAGQALIPIPVIGALVGGAVMATVGTFVGNAVSRTKWGAAVDAKMRAALGRLADRISPPKRAPAAAAPVAPVASAPAAHAVAPSPKAATPVVRVAAAVEPAGTPSFEDLPVGR